MFTFHCTCSVLALSFRNCLNDYGDSGSSYGCVLCGNWLSWLLHFIFLNKLMHGLFWLMQSHLWFGRWLFLSAYLFLFELVVIDGVEVGLFFEEGSTLNFPSLSSRNSIALFGSVISVNTLLSLRKIQG